MISVACGQDSIKLSDGCYTIKKATLSRDRFSTVALTITATGVTIPEPRPCKGVWQLNVTTDCGCFTAPVYIECEPPAFTHTYQPTSDTPMPIPVCCPLVEQPVFDGRAVVLREPSWMTYADGLAQGDLPEPNLHAYRTWRAYDQNGVELGCAAVTGQSLEPIATAIKPTWIRIDT